MADLHELGLGVRQGQAGAGLLVQHVDQLLALPGRAAQLQVQPVVGLGQAAAAHFQVADQLEQVVVRVLDAEKL